MSPDDLFKRPFPDENYIPPDEADLRKQALQKAYEIAQSITTEQNKPVETKPPVDRGPLLRAANAVLSVLVAAWLLFSPPDWLPQRTPDRRTPEQRELGLRMVLAMEAARVTAYRDAQGQLPPTLADAGGDTRSVTYVVLDAGRFRLTAKDGASALSY
ncbi:MAG: hypothetical protein P3B98_13295, partial [Gemmatimonadota bacterium]|nr:hypothetical protein [Gemmatimonadota bacterium]